MDLKTFLNESINDKYKFKAIFFAGIPGSGKSFVAKQMFGFDNEINLSAFGAKLIDPDILFEKRIKKGVEDPDWYDARDKRDDSLAYFSKEYIPIIISGTGRMPETLIAEAENLKKIGYDVYMIYVKTPLNTALERAKKRPIRSVNPDFIKEVYNLLQEGFQKYVEYFGKDSMLIVNNDKIFKNKEEEKAWLDILYKEGQKIITSPVKNPIGVQKIKEAEDKKHIIFKKQASVNKVKGANPKNNATKQNG